MGGTSWANKAASGAERGFSRVTHVHEITRTCKYGVAGAEGAPVGRRYMPVLLRFFNGFEKTIFVYYLSTLVLQQ